MIKIGIIGTGGMAHQHARSFQDIYGVSVTACCDIDEERVTGYAKEFKIPSTYTDVDKLLTEADVQAVSVVTPDPFHAPLSLKALASGKHVLCEKPLAVTYEDAQAMADAANNAGVINMVNLSYRNSSALIKAAELVQDGKLGDIKHVEASYFQSWLSSDGWGKWHVSPQWLWRLSSEHGSKGVLGDVGVHILDFATFPAGKMASIHCQMKTFDKAPGNVVDGYTLDVNDSAVMTIEFANGALGSVTATRYATGHANSLNLSVHGTDGALRIDLDKSYEELEVCLADDRHEFKWETITCDPTPSIYQRFITSIHTGQNDQPDFGRGAELQKALDACFVSDEKDRTISL